MTSPHTQEPEHHLHTDKQPVRRHLYLRISLKVSIVDGFYQLLCYLNDLLLTHCEQEERAI